MVFFWFNDYLKGNIKESTAKIIRRLSSFLARNRFKSISCAQSDSNRLHFM